MKKDRAKRLRLSRETLRNLDLSLLSKAVGGETSLVATECNSCSCVTCTTCTTAHPTQPQPTKNNC